MRSEYIDTMSKIMFSYFKDYNSKLLKMQVRGGAGGGGGEGRSGRIANWAGGADDKEGVCM